MWLKTATTFLLRKAEWKNVHGSLTASLHGAINTPNCSAKSHKPKTIESPAALDVKTGRATAELLNWHIYRRGVVPLSEGLTFLRLLGLWHRFKAKMCASVSGGIAETPTGRRCQTATGATCGLRRSDVGVSVRETDRSAEQQPHGGGHVGWLRNYATVWRHLQATDSSLWPSCCPFIFIMILDFFFQYCYFLNCIIIYFLWQYIIPLVPSRHHLFFIYLFFIFSFPGTTTGGKYTFLPYFMLFIFYFRRFFLFESWFSF